MIDFDMTTPQIIKALKKVGVDFNKAEFLADIKHGTPLSEIGDRWVDECNCHPMDHNVDFVSMAPIALWKRLAPEVPCAEMIHENIEIGYAAFEGSQHDAAFVAFQKAWDVFKLIKPHSMKKMDLNSSLDLWGGYCFGEWRHTFSNELLESWKLTKNIKYAEQRAHFCDEYCKTLPDEENCSSVLCDAAESYWDAGQREAAEAKFKDVIAKWPDDPWAYNLWGNRYFWWQEKDPTRHDYAKAEEIYSMGIKNVRKADPTMLLDRLQDLYNAAVAAGLAHLLKNEKGPSNVLRPKFTGKEH